MQRHHRHRCSTAAISTTAVVTVSLLVVLLLTGPAAAADAPEGAAAPALQNAVLQNSRVQAAPADAAATPPADAATGAAAATNGNGNSGDNGLELEPANGYTNGYGYGRRPECRAAEFTLASAGAKPAAPVAADAYSEASGCAGAKRWGPQQYPHNTPTHHLIACAHNHNTQRSPQTPGRRRAAPRRRDALRLSRARRDDARVRRLALGAAAARHARRRRRRVHRGRRRLFQADRRGADRRRRRRRAHRVPGRARVAHLARAPVLLPHLGGQARGRV